MEFGAEKESILCKKLAGRISENMENKWSDKKGGKLRKGGKEAVGLPLEQEKGPTAKRMGYRNRGVKRINFFRKVSGKNFRKKMRSDFF